MRGKLKVFKCCVWSIVNCVSRFDGNTELQRFLQEASLISFQMRFLFAPLCAFYYPKNTLQLWKTFTTDMCEDNHNLRQSARYTALHPFVIRIWNNINLSTQKILF